MALGGFLAQVGRKMVPRGFSETFPAVRLALVGSQVEVQNFTFMLKNYLKRAFEGHRRHFCRVLKKDLNIEASWDQFVIDFGTVLGGLGETKKRFSLESGYNFEIFSDLDISCLLDSQKPRFWLRSGGQVGVRKCTSWLQEASWADVQLVFEEPKMRSKKTCNKSHASRCRSLQAMQVRIPGVP